MDPHDASGFARIASELAAEPDLERTFHRVVERAQQTIRGADYAGFTTIRPDRLETVAASDPVVADLDVAQHQFGQGPCLEARREHATLHIIDTRTETRWPDWCARANDEGIRSVLSVRLGGSSEHLYAALNLYSQTGDAFDEDAVLTAEIYAAHAGAAISATQEATNLNIALQSRHSIGVAQGMLMLRYGLTEEQAFRFLARHSQEANVKLREVASRVTLELSKQHWPTAEITEVDGRQSW